MILVTLGTQDKKFYRLLDAIEKQISIGNIKEEVQKQISNENKPDSTLKPNSPISALLEENGLQEYQSVFDSAVSPNSLCPNI